jgi:hypothetical protein
MLVSTATNFWNLQMEILPVNFEIMLILSNYIKECRDFILQWIVRRGLPGLGGRLSRLGVE